MVSLQKYGWKHFCGGILIKKNLVLTAAHCVHSGTRGAVLFPSVAIGGVDVRGDADTETHQVCRTIIHPSYKGTKGGSDLALLVLSSNSNKNPIKLAAKDPEIGQALRVLGWGRMRNGRSPSTLQEGILDVLSNADCRKRITAQVPDSGLNILDSMVCAQREGVDACKGDSGGPLIQVPNGKNAEKTCGSEDILVGITSTGVPCTDVRFGLRFPGIYSRITDFASWIENLGGADAKPHLNFEVEECKAMNTPKPKPKPKPTGRRCRYIAGRWVPRGCRKG